MAATASSTSLYVGDLSKNTSESTLYETFSAAGSIASVRVCRDTTTRQSLGYAYVNFHRPEDADRAFHTLNFKNIDGKPCRIMWTHRDPTLRKSGMGNIIIKNLAKTIDQQELLETFSKFGNILSCKIAKDHNGNPLGYGFVHYETEKSAQDAIEQVNLKSIKDEIVTVMAFRSKEERETENQFTNVYVKNLPDDFTEDQLRDMFAPYGEINSSLLLKGFGFVNYIKHESATEAIQEMQNHTVGEKKLFVGRAKSKQERGRELHEKRAERERAGANLYVKNLSDSITDDVLKTEFQKHGTVVSCKVMMDHNENSRGFGFVSYANRNDAAKALAEMNGRMVQGKPLYVAFAQRKDQRKMQLDAHYSGRRMPGPPPVMMPYYQPPPQMYYPGYAPAPGYMFPPAGRPPTGYPQGPPRGAYTQYPRQQQGPPRGAMRPAPKPQPTAPALEPQKQAIGEKLYPMIKEKDPEQAGKITGMLLEMDLNELNDLLTSQDALDEKIREAQIVLQQAPQDQ